MKTGCVWNFSTAMVERFAANVKHSAGFAGK